MRKILGIDGGLAELGWCVLPIAGDNWLDSGVISTKRETKKRQLHVGSDDARRIDAIVEALERIFVLHGPSVIAYELPAASKGARAGHALGIAHGIVRTWGRSKAPLVEVTVLDARRAAVRRSAGTSKVTEDEAHEAICRRFTLEREQHSAHEIDAGATALAAIETPVVRALMMTAA